MPISSCRAVVICPESAPKASLALTSISMPKTRYRCFPLQPGSEDCDQDGTADLVEQLQDQSEIMGDDISWTKGKQVGHN